MDQTGSASIDLSEFQKFMLFFPSDKPTDIANFWRHNLVRFFWSCYRVFLKMSAKIGVLKKLKQVYENFDFQKLLGHFWKKNLFVQHAFSKSWRNTNTLWSNMGSDIKSFYWSELFSPLVF